MVNGIHISRLIAEGDRLELRTQSQPPKPGVVGRDTLIYPENTQSKRKKHLRRTDFLNGDDRIS